MKQIQLSHFVIAACLTLGWVPAHSAEVNKNPNVVKWTTGSILYRTIETQRQRALEVWNLTVHPDGSRTMRSVVNNFDAENQLNMIHRVTADFRPLESLVSYWSKGSYVGSGMFTIDGQTLNATVSGPDGLVTNHVKVPEHFSIVPHPLATDSWHTWYYDKKVGGPQPMTLYNLQIAPKTGTPVLGRLQTNTMTFDGREEVEVPAGVFMTDHFKIGKDVSVWLSGPDNMLVRYASPKSDLEYVLMTVSSGDFR
jgi:hypothetical protein